jgi:hypothetical protein
METCTEFQLLLEYLLIHILWVARRMQVFCWKSQSSSRLALRSGIDVRIGSEDASWQTAKQTELGKRNPTSYEDASYTLASCANWECGASRSPTTPQ